VPKSNSVTIGWLVPQASAWSTVSALYWGQVLGSEYWSGGTPVGIGLYT
jgi:hypothetical protein